MGNPTELLLCKIMKSKMASSNLTKQIVKSTSYQIFSNNTNTPFCLQNQDLIKA